MRDLYISTSGPPIFLQKNRQADRENLLIAHRNMSVGIFVDEDEQFHFWEYFFPIFGKVSLQCVINSVCSTTGKPTHLFRTKCVSLDSV